MTFISDGEQIGGNRQVFLDDTNAEAEISSDPNYGIALSITERNDPLEYFNIGLVSGEKTPFRVGSYDWRQRYVGEYWEPTLPEPSANFSHQGTSCPKIETQLDVRRVHFTDGQVDELLAYFDQRCQGSDGHAFGEVRIGVPRASIQAWPSAVRWPDTAAVGRGTKSFRVRFRSAQGSLGRPTIEMTGRDATRFAVVTNGCAQPADPHGCDVRLRFRPAHPGLHRAALVLSTPNGRATVALDGFGRIGRTSLVIDGAAGDPVTHGEDFRDSASAGDHLSVYGSATHLVLGMDNGPWDIDLAPPDGRVLREGQTWRAQRWPFNEGTFAGLSVHGPYESCNEVSGRFRINQLRFRPPGQPRNLDVEFVQSCDGAQPMRGRLRWLAQSDTRPPGPVTDVVVRRTGTVVRVAWARPGARDLADVAVRWYPGPGPAAGRPDVGFRVVRDGPGRAHFTPPAGTSGKIAIFALDNAGNIGRRVVARYPS